MAMEKNTEMLLLLGKSAVANLFATGIWVYTLRMEEQLLDCETES
jgi:hypothetical protein